MENAQAATYTTARPAAGEYPISQINCAAYLFYKDHKLLRLEPRNNGSRFVDFIFQKDATIIQDRVDYFEYQAVVCARSYAEALVELKRLAMEKLGGKRVNAATN